MPIWPQTFYTTQASPELRNFLITYIYIYYGYGSKQVAYLQLSITEVMNF